MLSPSSQGGLPLPSSFRLPLPPSPPFRFLLSLPLIHSPLPFRLRPTAAPLCFYGHSFVVSSSLRLPPAPAEPPWDPGIWPSAFLGPPPFFAPPTGSVLHTRNLSYPSSLTFLPLAGHALLPHSLIPVRCPSVILLSSSAGQWLLNSVSFCSICPPCLWTPSNPSPSMPRCLPATLHPSRTPLLCLSGSAPRPPRRPGRL